MHSSYTCAVLLYIFNFCDSCFQKTRTIAVKTNAPPNCFNRFNITPSKQSPELFAFQPQRSFYPIFPLRMLFFQACMHTKNRIYFNSFICTQIFIHTVYGGREIESPSLIEYRELHNALHKRGPEICFYFVQRFFQEFELSIYLFLSLVYMFDDYRFRGKNCVTMKSNRRKWSVDELNRTIDFLCVKTIMKHFHYTFFIK